MGFNEEEGSIHICHDRRHETGLFCPVCDELRETVTPEIFVDRYGNEDGPRDGFVGVDGIARDDGWEGRYLNSDAGIADYHDWLDWRQLDIQ